MPRPQNPDLTKYWKICLPATLAGTVEFYLFDRLHNKPKYGARGELLTRLLSDWVVEQKDPNARTRMIVEQIAPFIREDVSVSSLTNAIHRGLDVELSPSPAPIIPSSIKDLA